MKAAQLQGSLYLINDRSIYLPTYQSIYLSIDRLSINPSIYLPTYLCICLSVYLSIVSETKSPGRVTQGLSMEETFTKIYATEAWGKGSGAGSVPVHCLKWLLGG